MYMYMCLKRCCQNLFAHLFVFFNTERTVSIKDKKFVVSVSKKCLCVSDGYCDTIYVTLDHKTSHKGAFFEIEIHTSSES